MSFSREGGRLGKHTLHVAHVRVDGVVPDGIVKGGVLMDHATANPPWRVHLATTRDAGWAPGVEHELEITALEGVTVVGRAVLERTDGKAHMFFGVAPVERASPDA